MIWYSASHSNLLAPLLEDQHLPSDQRVQLVAVEPAEIGDTVDEAAIAEDDVLNEWAVPLDLKTQRIGKPSMLVRSRR